MRQNPQKDLKTTTLHNKIMKIVCVIWIVVWQEVIVSWKKNTITKMTETSWKKIGLRFIRDAFVHLEGKERNAKMVRINKYKYKGNAVLLEK